MRLILVRHAAVHVRPGRPSREWHLSPEGRAGAEALAPEPLWEGIDPLHTSPEPKAAGTAHRIAAPNSMRVCIERHLCEVERPWVGDEFESYRDHATRYLRGEAIAGWEPRADAQHRARATVDRLAADERNTVMVSHGLLLSLLLEDVLQLGADALVETWSSMRFPDIAVIDLQKRILERKFGE